MIAGILRDRFAAPPALFGGVVLYTLGTTVLPSLIFRRPPLDLEPHAPPLGSSDATGRAPRA
ncbi:MAG TPA: hypothetical protein VLV15_03040 [Dongiaceae bacterium]|nr:hypothetical protein [Dongiaceae bacterium]